VIDFLIVKKVYEMRSMQLSSIKIGLICQS